MMNLQELQACQDYAQGQVHKIENTTHRSGLGVAYLCLDSDRRELTTALEELFATS